MAAIRHFHSGSNIASRYDLIWTLACQVGASATAFRCAGRTFDILRRRRCDFLNSAIFASVFPLFSRFWPCSFYRACVRPRLYRRGRAGSQDALGWHMDRSSRHDWVLESAIGHLVFLLCKSCATNDLTSRSSRHRAGVLLRFQMTKTLQPAAKRALARRGSSCSR